jgi:Cof subfamily protein (haloacid dehalogenase superfamily)
MVVFFDIDGTVVDNETQIIPDSAVEAIRLLRQNGHMAVINTGRPYGQVDPRIRALDFNGWICACGMEIVLDGEYIYRDYPTAEQCRYIADLAHECKMAIQTESVDTLYYDREMPYNAVATREAERLDKKGIKIVAFQDTPVREFIKFVTYDTPGCCRQEFIDGVSHICEGIIRADTFVEYVKNGHSKAEGMDRFLKLMNIPREQTFAIGDSENDLPMFEIAGTTICMGDGIEWVKERADYVTDPVLRDGVYNGLKHFGLI